MVYNEIGKIYKDDKHYKVMVNNKKLKRYLKKHNDILELYDTNESDIDVSYCISNFNYDKPLSIVGINKNIKVYINDCIFNNYVFICNIEGRIESSKFKSELGITECNISANYIKIYEGMSACNSKLLFDIFTSFTNGKVLISNSQLSIKHTWISSDSLYLINNKVGVFFNNNINKDTKVVIENKELFNISDFTNGTFNGIDINYLRENNCNFDLINGRKELVKVLNKLKDELIELNTIKKEELCKQVDNNLVKVLKDR